MNIWKELPKPDEIYDYESLSTPDWAYRPADDVKAPEIKPKKSLTFTL